MKPMYRPVLVGSLAVVLAVALLPATAHAQVGVRRRPLGGYGSASIERYYRSGASGTLLPSGGGPGTFIPEGSIEPRPSIATVLSPFQIEQTPIGGMSGARTPIGGASLMPGRRYPAFGRRGVLGMGGVIRSSPVGRRAVMPSRLASPLPSR